MGPGRSIGLALALTAMLASGTLARAQPPSLGEQQARLRAAAAASAAARTRAGALEQAAASERDRAAQARAQEAAAAERIRATQADIAAALARIGIVDRQLAAQRGELAVRQAPILRLIAALQAMARRPAVLGLVQPGSTADMVHVRAVLGTTLPVVAARTAQVRAELARVQRLRADARAALASLRDGRTRLEAERIALVKLEAGHRLRSTALGRDALVESDRALALGERARDIVDQMETAGEAGAVEAALVALPGPLPVPTRKAGHRHPLRARPPIGCRWTGAWLAGWAKCRLRACDHAASRSPAPPMPAPSPRRAGASAMPGRFAAMAAS